MEEVWKDIYFVENEVEWDYRGLYQVSNLGRVRSLGNGNSNNSKERILKAKKDKKGYLSIGLYKNAKTKGFRIHRLVAHLFLGDSYFNGAEINHIDENKENNNANNLEWCTREYNVNHGTRNKKAGESIGKSQRKKIIGYSLTETKVIIFKSATQAKKFGFNHGHISDCCNGKRKQHKGYIWRFIEEN